MASTACRSPASTRPAAPPIPAARSPARRGATPRRCCCKTLDSTSRRWWPVPDARVQAAIDNWAPRFTTNGVDPNDFRTTTARIERWDEWLDAGRQGAGGHGGAPWGEWRDAWAETAEGHVALADEARAEGRERSAGEAYVRAAVCFHFAK